MKLVALLIASSFIALSQVGVRVGRPQTVFIVEPVQSGNLSDDVARLSRESGGRDLDLDSLNLTTDGSRILFPPDGPVPRVDFETWVEGIAKQHAESVTSGFSPVEREPGKVAIERYVRDEFGHLYFRYRLVVEVLPGAETYRATFGDASGTIPKQVPADWTTLTPPQYPVPQIVHDGDTIPLELYRGAATRTLVEYIHFGQRSPVFRTEAAREIYSEIAEFNVAHPQLRINGIGVEMATPESLHGALLWLYVPGQGRYHLSFKPRPDFTVAGEASGNSLVFIVEGNLFRLEGTERMAEAGSAAYRVYAQREPAWRPDEKDASRARMGVEQ